MLLFLGRNLWKSRRDRVSRLPQGWHFELWHNKVWETKKRGRKGKTSPKGFSASKCNEGNWMFSKSLRNCLEIFWILWEHFLELFCNFGVNFLGFFLENSNFGMFMEEFFWGDLFWRNFFWEELILRNFLGETF